MLTFMRTFSGILFTLAVTLLVALPVVAQDGASDLSNEELLELYDGLRVADVTDGMDMVGLRGVGLVDQRIQALWKDIDELDHQVRGIAVTARYVPANKIVPNPIPEDEFGAWEGQWYNELSPEPFVEEIEPGTVVVIDADGDGDTGSIGSYNALAWYAAGARGIVTTGSVRDIDEIIKQEVPVYLKTGLDIPRALDPKDQDYVQVQPHPLMTHVLNAVQSLGFQLVKVDCEHSRMGLTPHPFVQEFEFRPSGEYRRRLEELELIFRLQGETLDVFLELDRRARGLSGLFDATFDMNERFAHLQVTPATTGDLQSRLAQVIESHAR